ncbi:NAD-dependent epimerase/dehydratase family protein [Pseudomonas sp. N040]|uniref:NAD-dependent epimerase/dehydratase family protein n=1 Tax=Pseudomonas sp. N040 TaxID=2785325 RepID=UPI0018A27923|nr:NAD-dependent epimerase/dehydratase family protein [Pseudomonas sp. N040]MBF7731316.1 NAD-dependent epimerase/dehydratase family protein [Pseudomonas sp. N040]MBW7014959.1 NAD-dependent epimerase/dehydratase family protein [Pseudomonas sp. N040]
MKIFITGASGFVGGAATRRLVAAGHEVHAMSRSPKSDALISQLGAEPVRCDLDDVSAGHLQGCAVVIHAAAFVEAWGEADAWERANVGGTRNMLKAARAAGVQRFIHIGTEAALVRGQDLHQVDESYPLAFDSPYPYCATKARAEQAVLAANDVAGGFVTLVLRPRFIWGPGDATLLPVILELAKAGRWSWIDQGRAMTSTTFIDNLVDAIVLALTAGQPGGAYFILDEGNRSLREIISGMAATAGVTLGDKSIPGWLAACVGALSEWLWRTFSLKGAPPLTRHAAMVMRRECTLVGDKARVELGYVPRVSVEEGLRRLRASLAG